MIHHHAVACRTQTQAIELCSEKAGDLQTTLIHLQWQKKHVEQCRMAERGLQEVAQATENDISLAVIDSGEKYACNTSCQGGIGIVDGSVGLAAAKSLTEELASMAGLSCSLTGSTAEMLQLETKGRALAEAVAVVENALRKMEEQVGVRGSVDLELPFPFYIIPRLPRVLRTG